MTEKRYSANSNKKWDEYKDWTDQRNALDDWAEYISNKTGKLNRSALCKENGWGTQVPYSNSRIRADLVKVEIKLLERGIAWDKGSIELEENAKTSDRQAARAQQHASQLEEQVAALKAELSVARSTMKKMGIIDRHLFETGRLIRGFKND